ASARPWGSTTSPPATRPRSSDGCSVSTTRTTSNAASNSRSPTTASWPSPSTSRTSTPWRSTSPRTSSAPTSSSEPGPAPLGTMGVVTSTAEARPTTTPFARYRHSLWLLTKRDLRVRYSTSALGYLWSILDPLLMAGIYFFVFAVVFHRGGVGQSPYIVFLITALLPWVWFIGAVSDSTRAF